MKLKLKRVAPGYYEGPARTKLDGKPWKVMARVVQAQRGAWYWTIDSEDAEDWYPTKREAAKALAAALEIGFRRSKWGLVLAR